MIKEQLDFLKLKASVTAHQMHQMFIGQPVYTDEKYERMVQEGNNKNIWVYASVRAIARAGAAVPLIVYQKDAKGKLTEISNHPLQLLLDKPNEQDPSNDFMEAWLAYMVLAGNAYVELNGPSKNGPPTELWLWRPDRTTIVPGKEGAEYLRYTVNGQDIDIPYNRALHTKFFHPTNDYYGLTPLQVARRTVDMDNSTTDWNTTLVQNYGAPGGILKAPVDAQIPLPQLKRIKRTIRRMFGGKDQAGKTHLLEGGLEWQQLGLSPKDMDFIDSRKMTREEICAVFGVPPQIVGIQDKSTYNNYSEARQSFYQDTVLPTLDKIISAINHKLAPLYGENTVVGYDKTQIEALQESADAKYNRLSKLKEYLSMNEMRQELGFEPVEHGDVWYVPNNVTAMSPDDLSVDSTADEEPKEDNEIPEEETPIKSALGFLTKAQQELRTKSEADEFNAEVDTSAERANKLIARLFKEEWQDIETFLSRHKAGDHIDAELFGELEVGISNVLDSKNNDWYALMIALYTNGAAQFFDWQKHRLKGDARRLQLKFDEYEFEDISDDMQAFIEQAAAEQVSYIEDWTREEIKKILMEALEGDLSIGYVATELKMLYFDEFSTYRAYRIARTEMMAAASYGKQQGALSLDLPMNKIWKSTFDNRTRESHVAAHDQTVDIRDYYSVNGHDAMHPGDPDLPASERIHCRCVEVYEVRMDEI